MCVIFKPIRFTFITRFTPTKDEIKSLCNLVDEILNESATVKTESNHLFGLSFAIICYQVVKSRTKFDAVNCRFASKIKGLVMYVKFISFYKFALYRSS